MLLADDSCADTLFGYRIRVQEDIKTRRHTFIYVLCRVYRIQSRPLLTFLFLPLLLHLFDKLYFLFS